MRKSRFSVELAAALAAVILVGVLIAAVAGPVYVIPLVIVVVIVGLFLGSTRAAVRSKRDPARRGDDPLPAQGLDAETPLGDTDQHSRSSA
jgi:hypothetical protein